MSTVRLINIQFSPVCIAQVGCTVALYTFLKCMYFWLIFLWENWDFKHWRSNFNLFWKAQSSST